jgi:hypothetical protein
MAVNLTALSPITTSAIALSNLILVNPQTDAGILAQPRTSEAFTPKKFLFNYYGEQAVTLESDITDHYVEDNTALQDQIALRPEIITGHGFIGELTDIAPEILQSLKVAADKLTVIGGYTPDLTTTGLIAYNNAVQVYQVAQLATQSAVNAWSSIGPTVETQIGNAIFAQGNVQSKQQIAFQMFYGYWKERRLFTVQTPWAVFQNCALKTVRAVQDAESNTITDFEVTFKPINYAKTVSVGIAQFGQLRNQSQSQEGNPVNLGDSKGTPSPLSQGTLLQSVTP